MSQGLYGWGGLLCAAVIGCGGANSDVKTTDSVSATTERVAAPEQPALQPVPTMSAETEPSTESSLDAKARQLFDRWVASATESDPDAWTKAEQELQTLGAAAVPALIEVLNGDQPLSREMAVMFLAQLGPQAEPAAEALAGLLTDPSSLVRVNAAGALTTFETALPAAVATLVELLADADVNIRATAAGCLGNVAELPTSALNRLIETLDDPTPAVRTAAAASLGRIGRPAAAALPKLRQLAVDDHEAVRHAATFACRQVDPASSPAGEAVPAGATDAGPLLFKPNE